MRTIIAMVLMFSTASAEDLEVYPDNLGPPETLFACRPAPTMIEDLIYNCAACLHYRDSSRTFNTCTD